MSDELREIFLAESSGIWPLAELVGPELVHEPAKHLGVIWYNKNNKNTNHTNF